MITIILQPASEPGRFRTFLFDSSSFGDEKNEYLLHRCMQKNNATTKKHKNIGIIVAMCEKSAIFAFKFENKL